MLILHFSPQTRWQHAASRKGCVLPDLQITVSVTPFPNVSNQGFPVRAPEKNNLSSSQKQAGSVDAKAGSPETKSLAPSISKAHLSEQWSALHRADVMG